MLKEARKFMESSKEMGVRVLGKIGKVTYMAEFIRDQSCYRKMTPWARTQQEST